MLHQKKQLILIILLISNFTFATQLIPLGAKFDIGFSPKMGALDIVLKGIEAAEKQILVASYSFTSKPIATALLNAYNNGVNVCVIADKKINFKQYSAVRFLANKGISVRLNGNYKIHHNKFMIIDNQHIEIGSFNYSSAAANKNAENVLLLWNVKPIADIYSKQWKQLWNEATPLKQNY